ncbi:TetR family transcriptional regulator [Amycolatopsis sp. NPDC051102]|uniref:TetR/AcrR family transcriptional regulator n=1 Tax=Amycolatopsis sp. NPDC051102 TaxID=3155163 RepID=UPI003414209B
MAKSEETRSLIVTTAMRLFTENGYNRTTMRAIAAEAGVSVGNAYYYFSSKEQLVQGFYDEMAGRHLAAARPLLDGEAGFAARLRAVLLCWLDVAEPYHRFGTQFFVNAADPESPLSPFSDDSSAAREASIGLMREVVEGSDVKLDPELRAQLPELLWLYQMGVVLFWVHDRSAGTQRSRMLVERSVPLLARLAALSRLRVFRPVSREIVGLIQDLAKRD